MPQVTIREPTASSVLYVAERLREADRRELEHASGLTSGDALVLGVKVSEVCLIGCLDDEPFVIFGVAPGGVVWMVCTDDVRKAKQEVFQRSKEVIEELLKVYPRLWNRADCRNTLHLRWLQKVGFTFDEIEDVKGLGFQRFHIDRKDSKDGIEHHKKERQEGV